jgi:hypothetical protein
MGSNNARSNHPYNLNYQPHLVTENTKSNQNFTETGKTNFRKESQLLRGDSIPPKFLRDLYVYSVPSVTKILTPSFF